MSTLNHSIIVPEYHLIGFFHQHKSRAVWAVGYPVTGSTKYDYDSTKPTVLKSYDNFTNYIVIKQWNVFPNDQFGNPLTAPWLSIYVDEYSNIYIGTSPNILTSIDGGVSWALLPGVDFSYGGAYSGGTVGHLNAYPNWVWSEDLETHTMYISQYGKGHLVYHSGINRSVWSVSDFSDFGYYFHIHTYQVNPYNPSIHLISCGDPEDKGIDPSPPAGAYPQGADVYISQDHGVTWNKGLLNHDVNGNTSYYFGHFSNAPCMTSWLPDGSAFITPDDASENGYIRVGQNNDWARSGITIPLTAVELDPSLVFPATTWDSIAVKDSYDIYMAVLAGFTYEDYDDNGDPYDVEVPSGIFKYNAQTGIKSIGIFNDPGRESRVYISNTIGNVAPSDAPYVFSNMYGGIKIETGVQAPQPTGNGIYNTGVSVSVAPWLCAVKAQYPNIPVTIGTATFYIEPDQDAAIGRVIPTYRDAAAAGYIQQLISSGIDVCWYIPTTNRTGHIDFGGRTTTTNIEDCLDAISLHYPEIDLIFYDELATLDIVLIDEDDNEVPLGPTASYEFIANAATSRGFRFDINMENSLIDPEQGAVDPPPFRCMMQEMFITPASGGNGNFVDGNGVSWHIPTPVEVDAMFPSSIEINRRIPLMYASASWANTPVLNEDFLTVERIEPYTKVCGQHWWAIQFATSPEALQTKMAATLSALSTFELSLSANSAVVVSQLESETLIGVLLSDNTLIESSISTAFLSSVTLLTAQDCVIASSIVGGVLVGLLFGQDSSITSSASLSSLIGLIQSASITINNTSDQAVLIGSLVADNGLIEAISSLSELIGTLSSENLLLLSMTSDGDLQAEVLIGSGSIRSPSGSFINMVNGNNQPITIYRHVNGQWQI